MFLTVLSPHCTSRYHLSWITVRSPAPYCRRFLLDTGSSTTVTGNIYCSSSDLTVEGYVSATTAQYGVYGSLQPSTTDALQVSITYTSDSLSQLDIIATNGLYDSTYPYVGGGKCPSEIKKKYPKELIAVLIVSGASSGPADIGPTSQR